MNRQDTQAYLDKKRFFNRFLTVYGRKPVLEALQQPELSPYRLHLADSNKSSAALDQLIALARLRGAEICYHNRQALSRISRSARQDQGVAIDVKCPQMQSLEDFLSAHHAQPFTLLALDGVTNPQNLGMIIRSATAGRIDGILLPTKGGANIDPLVIKASVGTVFRAPLLRTELPLHQALTQCLQAGADICGLSSHAPQSLQTFRPQQACVFVLGNETSGVSSEVQKICTQWVSIPMNNGVESLNVAVTAALIAFRHSD